MSRFLAGIGIAACAVLAGVGAGTLLRAELAPDEASAGPNLQHIAASLAPAGMAEDMAPVLAERTEDLRAFVQKREGLRTECAESLRRANRDQQWEAAVRCVRNELALETLTLRPFIAALRTRKDSPAAAAAAAKADMLFEALTAMTQAVDNGVFGDEETLGLARTRLHERYRLPLAASELTLQWDALQTAAWVAADAAALLGDEVEDAAALCLRDAAAALLEGRKEPDPEAGRAAFARVAAAWEACLPLLPAEPQTATGALEAA